jgi:uncharacterized membrane protein YdbT with pleckstrin-like domain
MAYIHSVLQPGETIKVIGRLHWIIYLRSLLMLAIGGVHFLITMVRRSITELSVTAQRLIYKHGFIRRRTVEMALDKVETVDVDQTIGGRILGYGTIQVRGTGQGIEGLARVQSPIRLRTAITTA